MVFDYILYGVAFFGLLVGSYTDLKTKEVPDWISYGLIFSGLGLRMIFSLSNFEWNIFFEGLVGFLVFVVLAYGMYYLGQWGGGDAKLLMGMGAIIGLSLDFSTLPKLGVFIINLALAGMVYGLVWLFILALKNKDKFLVEFKKQRAQAGIMNIVFLGMMAVGLIGGFVLPEMWRGISIVMGFVPVGSLYVWMLTNSIEKVSFYKTVKPEKLTEGDWIAKDIIVNGEKICGPKDLGINEEQISKLVELRKKGKIKDILIKEGIPFMPSFLFGFVMTVVWGSWWLRFI